MTCCSQATVQQFTLHDIIANNQDEPGHTPPPALSPSLRPGT